MPIKCGIQPQQRPAGVGLRTGYTKPTAPFGTDKTTAPVREVCGRRASVDTSERNPIRATGYNTAEAHFTKRMGGSGADATKSPFDKGGDDFKAMKGGSLGRKASEMGKLIQQRSAKEMATESSAGPPANAHSLHYSTRPTNRRHSSQIANQDTTVGATCRVATDASGGQVCFVR
eukprot:TRINITY_DN59919_c0_g1_i1.p1 TRINITY_DN59919_c0_g1~~TRINITY_DN59919_c0_g1_i1.p1  ORF type:complete len:175 (+),score=49.08 TRINITY_DN59919_c0_g1_i1:80-604(+)